MGLHACYHPATTHIIYGFVEFRATTKFCSSLHDSVVIVGLSGVGSSTQTKLVCQAFAFSLVNLRCPPLALGKLRPDIQVSVPCATLFHKLRMISKLSRMKQDMEVLKK